MAYYRVNTQTGQREEIPEQEFLSLQSQSKSSREGFTPNLLQAFKARASQIGTMGNPTVSSPEYSPTFGGQIGQIIGGTMADLPAYTIAATTGPLGLAGLLGYGYATSPGKTSSDKMAQALFTAAPAAIPYAKPAIQSLRGMEAPKFGESIKGAVETIRRPKEIEKEIEAIKPQREAASLAEKDAIANLGMGVDEAISHTNTLAEKAASKIESHLGYGDLETSRANVADSVQALANELHETNEGNYTRFHEQYGETPIQEQIDFNQVAKSHGIDKAVLNRVPEIKPLIQRLSVPYTLGGNLGIKEVSKHFVRDYIGLYRALRDAAFDLGEQSRLAVGAEKSQLKAASSALNSLKKDLEVRFKSSLPEEGLQSFESAQKYYGEHIAPLRGHRATRGIIEKGTVPNNYFDSLNQPGLKPFFEKIKSNESTLAALVNHYLTNKNILTMSPQKIIDLLKSDQGRLIPKDIRTAIAEYAGYKHDLNYLSKIKSQAKAKGTIAPNQAVKDILEKHPELAEPFKDIKEIQKRMADFERLLKEKGIEKHEAEQAAAKYWKIVSAAKTAKAIKAAILKVFHL